MALLRQFCTFTVDGLLFGVDVLRVQEVIRYQVMTRVPLAPPVVSGLINLRGQIVMAIDMRRRLDLTPWQDVDRPDNVVVRTTDGPVSLLVDEIGNVLELEEHLSERPPETVPLVIRELTTGIYKLQDRLLIAIDPERVVDHVGFCALVS